MTESLTVHTGHYQTVGGYSAYVWEYGKNLLKEDCWLGTVKGVGTVAWDNQGHTLGRDEEDVSELDLVLESGATND